MTTRAILAGVSLLLAFPAPAVAQTVEISEWLVPWEDSRPRDPCVDDEGRVWFVGQRADYVANLTPENGEFSRYDLPTGTGPHNLIVADAEDERTIWVAGNRMAYIGRLDPATGRVERIEMPHPDARDPHTLVFDSAGDIWFTVQQGNFVGKLTVANESVSLIAVPTKRARPYGIVIGPGGVPWVALFGTNKLARVDPESMTLTEIELPDEDSRPRRLVTTADGRVWWVDYELGRLGRLDPQTDEIDEWPMPGGEDSRPYGMAVDRDDRLWFVETGVSPNRFTGFDPERETFFSRTEIPSGGDTVRHMYYYEPAGEVWFGTDTNYVGRARVHP